MYTEEEAKEKWCPMARTVSTAMEAAVNRKFTGYGIIDPDCYCIASGCMMWRTTEEPEAWKMAREAQPPYRTAPGFGYCGLAGKGE